ncbi:hypothetical protein L6R46_05385 [Myxococcota bacterium]|nr:hypothetical protein [Myxococcota bacterium]
MIELPTERHDLKVRYAGPRGPMPRHLGLWRDVFVSWRDVLEAYSRVAGEEGWRYDERPQLGFLSTAIWNVKGVTLAEYPVTKQGFYDRRKRYPGRGDLRAHLGDTTYAIEAKHRVVRIGTPSTAQTLYGLLDTAGWDSLRNREDVHYRAAVCFAPLVASATIPAETREGFLGLAETQQIIKGMFNRGFRVDLFPSWTQGVVRADGAQYVGVTLLVGMDDV